ARLLVSLASEGFLPWDPTTLAGAVTLCGWLLADSDVSSCPYVIQIVESALPSTITEPATGGPLLALRAAYGSALGEAGQVAQAITAFEQLLADQRRLLGPDHANTLTTRSNLASWLGESGQVDQAITAYEQLLSDQRRLLGPDHANTLTTRGTMAGLLATSGQVDQAITAYEQLLSDQRRLLGPDHANTPTTRGP